MTMQWVLAILFVFAALLQIAVYLAPDTDDPPIKGCARRIRIVSLVLMAGYFAWSGVMGGWVHPWLICGLALSVFSDICFAFNRLFPGDQLWMGRKKWRS
jgi:uncharacterized membrane protein